jgi:hypothetical protein
LYFSWVLVQIVALLTVLAGSHLMAGTGQSPAPFQVNDFYPKQYQFLIFNPPDRARLQPRSDNFEASGVLYFSWVLVQFVAVLTVLAGSHLVAGTGQSPSPFRIKY